jgi:uncharacterized protein (TIGR00304 family)
MDGKSMKARPSYGPSLYFAGALCLFILAGVLMALAVWQGEAQAGIFLIFPYISGGGLFLGLGMLLVIVGFVVLVLGSVKRFGAMTFEDVFEDELPVRKKKQRPRTVGDQEVDAPRVRGGFKGGGVVFIGPVPIVFGPDVKVTKLMLYLSIVLVIALCLLFFALSYRGI